MLSARSCSRLPALESRLGIPQRDGHGAQGPRREIERSERPAQLLTRAGPAVAWGFHNAPAELSWLEVERANLLAAILQAVAARAAVEVVS